MAIHYFRSKAAASIFLMPDTASAVFKAWDRTDRERGVLSVEDLPKAIAQLDELIARDDEECREQQRAAEAEERKRAAAEREDPQPVVLARVSYKIRLWPLREMLERSLRKKKPVTWGF